MAKAEANDPDGDDLTYTYHWILNGNEIPGEETDQLSPEFFAKGDEIGLFLIVTDGDKSTSRNIGTIILNSAPQSEASADSPVISGREIPLNGKAEDADGDSLSYSWTQTAGAEVEIRNADKATASFTSPSEDGELVFQLLVSDGEQSSEPSEVRVLVRNTPPQITSLQITPSPAFTDSELQAEVSVSNHDRRDLSYVYTWMVNGEEIPEASGETLAPKFFHKDDRVQVALQVTDGYGDDADSATLTIADSPPSVKLSGVPESAIYGQAVNFRIDAQDKDDDPLDFQFLARPNGMEIDDKGNITWTPTGPLFVDETNFNWEVVVTGDNNSETAGSTIRVIDEDRRYPLSRSGIEVAKNQEQIRLGDFDNDDKNELLITDGRQRLFTLSHNGTDYIQDWLYPFSLAGEDENISSIAAAEINGDGQAEFFVGLTSSYHDTQTKLLILDGATRKLAEFIEIDGHSVRAIHLADTDLDKQLELVLLIDLGHTYGTGQIIQIRDAQSLELEWQSSEIVLGSAMTLGNTDSDPQIEIVLSNGYIFGYSGSSYENEWIFGEGFGYREVQTGDLDGDGIDEIVGISNSSYALRVYSATEKAILTEKSNTRYAAIAVGNIDADPEAEIVVGSAAAYTFTSGSGLTEEWISTTSGSDESGLLIGDADNDGKAEIIWGSGTGHSGADALVVAGLNPDFEIEWINTSPSQLDGTFFGGEPITLSSGERRLSFASLSTDSGGEGSRLIYLDPDTGVLEIGQEQGSNWEGALALCPADYNLDGVYELFIATNEVYNPAVYLYDPSTQSTLWTAPSLNESGVATACGDLNGDQLADFVVTSSDGATFAYDVANSTLIWSDSAGGGRDVSIADLNDDDSAELVTASGTELSVTSRRDGVLNKMYSASIRDIAEVSDNASITDIAIEDLDGDGTREIAVVARYYSDQNWVLIYEPDLTLRSVFSIGNYIRALAIENYGDGHRNLLLNVSHNYLYSSGNSFIAIVDPYSGKTVYRSPEISSSIPLNSVHFIDLDGDGIQELSYGTRVNMNVTR